MNNGTRLEPVQPAGSRGAGTEAAADFGPGPDSGAKLKVMGLDLPTGSDPLSVRKRIEGMEMLLERSLKVPGTNIPIGLDSVIGLVPVVGDIIAAAMGAYIVWEARNLKMPKWKLARMAGNVLLDTAVGAVPVVGDALDFVYRSNSRNLKIVKKHLDKHHPQTRIIEQ